VEVTVFPGAEHAMIAVEQAPGGPRLAGRHAEGYFDRLIGWILEQAAREGEPGR